MRLQKFLSAAGACSRRTGEEFIRAGRVAVNGRVADVPGVKIDPESDRITLDGAPVTACHKQIYIAINKPEGIVTSCRQKGEKTVMTLIDIPERVYPVGRLDKDSIGLLLMTNDGRLHHRLLHPSYDHEKEYEVTLAEPVSDGVLEKLSAGLPVLGTLTRKAGVARISKNRFRMILKEGKNRQIRRMVGQVGGRVVELKRVRVAHIRLGGLLPGKWRYLTDQEARDLVAGALKSRRSVPPAASPEHE